jgi:subtilase family serine protease
MGARAMHNTFKRALLASAAAAVIVPAAASPAGAAAPARRPLPGSRPGWAAPARDRGTASANRKVEVRLYLPLRDAAGAQALAQAVSDPADAAYAQYLSPASFRDRFSPTAADVSAVRSFLSGAGLKVGDVPANGSNVPAIGTVGQMEKAFGIDVHRYAYRGRLLNAPTASPTIPAALSGKVLAISGLDDSGLLTQPGSRHGDAAPRRQKPDAAVTDTTPTDDADTASAAQPPPDAFVNAPPCSAYFGEKQASDLPPVNGQVQPYAPCGYTPDQFQGAYGMAPAVAGGLDGRGVTVAITDAYAAPTILDDANEYATRHGQQPFADGQFTQVVPKKHFRFGGPRKCDAQGWYGEETLDVEAVHAMAPGANVVYVAGRSCTDPDLLDALNKIVDNKLATVVTNSWGDVGEDVPPDTLQAYQQVFVQAALEGIGMFFSSGDDGDDSIDTADGSPAVDFPSTDPWVTAVGGTSLGVGQNDDNVFETGWSTGRSALSADGTAWEPPFPGDFLYGAGGGVSSLFDEPAYQRRVVPDAIAGGHRATPDIAMDGDPNTGMLVGETQTFPDGSVRYSEYRIGGTSLASPLYAGVEALADQAAGRSHGFANPAIYALSGGAAVRDIKDKAPVAGVARVDYVNSVDAADGTLATMRYLDDELGSIHIGPGWDTITGVGAPNGVSYLTSLAPRR